MNKTIKRTFSVMLLIIFSFLLFGCVEDTPNEPNKENTGNENQDQAQTNQGTLAKIEENLQGYYIEDDVVIEVGESTIKITDSNGEVEYSLYELDGKIYYEVEGKKIYCTFSDGYLSNVNGVYTKDLDYGVQKVKITFEVTIPNLEQGEFTFVIVGSFSDWKCLKANALAKDGDIYKITLDIKKDETIEYKYAILTSDGSLDKVELMLNSNELQNRSVIANEDKIIQDKVERFKNVKLSYEVVEQRQLLDSTFYDNDRGTVHQLNFDENRHLVVSYSKGDGKSWSCIIRPLEDGVSGRLATIKFTFQGQKDVQYLFKLEGGDGNQEESVTGTGEIQEYEMRVSESAVNSARLVIFAHAGQTGTNANPLVGEYTLISVMATLHEPIPETERIPGENPIHILAIGNSFSDDGLWLLYNILEQLGYDDIIVANLYIGGCTVATHKSNLENDAAAYTYRINKDGTWNNKNGYKASKALAEQRWDFISLQQASDHSGLVDKYVEADINYIYEYALNIAKEKNPDVKFVWHMTWAYQQNSTHSAFVNYNKNQMTMYNGILNAVQTVIVPNSYNPIVVPSGTTIQNLRTTFLGDTITRDGYHLNEAFGRYAAALTWAIKLTGKDITNINRPASVLAKHDALCKEAAMNACAKPFEVTASVYTEDTNQVVINYDNYTLLDQADYIIGNGYYNSGDASKFLTPIQDGSDFCNKFITTKLFTPDDLPIGSIIVVGDGYQYRPEGWIDEAKQANRNGNTTEKIIVVDEAWWGNYIYRAFNLSKLDGTVLVNDHYTAALENFKIYIPKTN